MERESVIVSDPEILGGTPCFRGTRVPVDSLIDYLEAGEPLTSFWTIFPRLAERPRSPRWKKQRPFSPACDEDPHRRESTAKARRTSRRSRVPHCRRMRLVREEERSVVDTGRPTVRCLANTRQEPPVSAGSRNGADRGADHPRPLEPDPGSPPAHSGMSRRIGEHSAPSSDSRR